MDANSPISNHGNDYTSERYAASSHIEQPAPIIVADNDDEKMTPAGPHKRHPSDEPTTPNIQLTPRQQRVFRYLARRRMRHARIVRRSTNDEEPEYPTLTNNIQSIPSVDKTMPFPALPATPVPPSSARTSPALPEVGKIPTPPRKLSPPDPHARFRHRRRLRHFSRKHIRQARAHEYRARRKLWLTIGSVVMSILVVLLSLGTAGTVIAYQFYTDTQTKYTHQVVTLSDHANDRSGPTYQRLP